MIGYCSFQKHVKKLLAFSDCTHIVLVHRDTPLTHTAAITIAISTATPAAITVVTITITTITTTVDIAGTAAISTALTSTPTTAEHSY